MGVTLVFSQLQVLLSDLWEKEKKEKGKEGKRNRKESKEEGRRNKKKIGGKKRRRNFNRN